MKNFAAFSETNGIKLTLRKTKLLFLALLLSVVSLKANTYGQENISVNFTDVALSEVFKYIETHSDYKIFYQNSVVDDTRKISLNAENITIEALLKRLFADSKIQYEILKEQIILKERTAIKKTSAVNPQEPLEGIVTDNSGLPLLGASIIVKGTTIGVNADINGEFAINASSGDILSVSFLGYKSKDIPIEDQDFLEIILEEDRGDLDEVVVVGYGSTEKRNLVGSVGTVDMANVQAQAPTVNLDQALQGQVSGVFVQGSHGQPGSPARIRIRGTTSLQGSNQPLFVIDGIPVNLDSNIPTGGTQGNNLGQALAQQGLNTPIGNINANDIESISVLKDASAGAIYGSRAANGVIIVNTKSGSFSQAPQFNVDYSTSIQEPRTLDVLNAQQFREVTTTAVENGTIDNAYTQSVLDGSYFGNADTNWEDVLSPSNPFTSDLNLSINGGTDQTRYFSGISAHSQEGSLKGSSFKRYSFRLNLDTKLSDLWNFGVRSNVSYTDQNAIDGSVTDRMYIFRPDVPVRDENGDYTTSSAYSLENPVALADGKNRNRTLLVLSSFFAELNITEKLKAKSLISINYNNGAQNSFYPRYTGRGGWSAFSGMGDGYAQESSNTQTNLMWENTLRYNDLFNEVHGIDAVVGASFEQNHTSQVRAWGTGYFNDVLTNITSATVNRDASSQKTAYGLESYFGRVNYNYDSRYLLNVSARVDGSSKFARENTHAFFPAAGLGWRISEENFLADNDKINQLKVRTSWGVTGQQDFGPYQWRTLYETEDYGDTPAIVLSQLGNDRLKWERSKQFDLGVDFGFFNNRLSGSFGYYSKVTEDAIFSVISPGNTGFSSVLANVGSTENKGFELELDGDIIRTEDFIWNLSINASTNKNKLLSISDDFKDEDGNISGFPGGGLMREGSPLGLIYGYVNEGIFQNQEEIDALNEQAPSGNYQFANTSPGDLKFSDLNGDGVVNAEDQDIIGNAQPEFFGGVTNTLSYKGFTLTTLFTFSVGNDLHWFNQARSINFGNSALGENKTPEVLNAWTEENPTNQPRLVYGDPNDNDRISSYYVYDASYLRLKTLHLNYTFPSEIIQKTGFLNTASIYVTGQNLLTFTNYPGADPETSNLFNNDLSAGRDNNRYPVARVFTAGVRIGF